MRRLGATSLTSLFDRMFGVRRLVEQGSVRGRTRTGYVLLRVHDHLRYTLALLGPEADREVVSRLRGAQRIIERRLGYIPLPMEGVGPRFDAAGHLRNAAAICDEYLTGNPLHPEGRIHRNVAEANRNTATFTGGEKVSL